MKINLKKMSVAALGSAILLAAAAVVFSQQPQGPPTGPPTGGGLRGPVGPGGPDGFGPFGPGGPRDGFGPRGPREGLGPGGPPDGFGPPHSGLGPGVPGDGFGPGAPQGPGPGFNPFGPLGRDLNLTADQRIAITRINESFRESNHALLDQMRTLRERQADLMTTEFNEAGVRAAAEARARVQVELEIAHARMMSQMFAVLSEEQKAQFAARRQEMQQMGPPQPPTQPQ